MKPDLPSTQEEAGGTGDPGWRERVYLIIFEAETTAGFAFDAGLLVAIVVSVVAVMLESVPEIRTVHGPALRTIEWILTGLFTLEYVVRLAVVRHPLRYATSFFGVVDLLAVLPTYLSLALPGSQSLITIRALRLLRIFRVFKLARFLGQANVLVTALQSSARKVVVFLGTLLILVLILGSAMYLVEGEQSGFTSIPTAIYWAIVTTTTVGYGDIAPVTTVGKALAATAMILGYSIIAVPTGIVTAEIVESVRQSSNRTCPSCLTTGHERDAEFCRRCGASLPALRG